MPSNAASRPRPFWVGQACPPHVRPQAVVLGVGVVRVQVINVGGVPADEGGGLRVDVALAGAAAEPGHAVQVARQRRHDRDSAEQVRPLAVRRAADLDADAGGDGGVAVSQTVEGVVDRRAEGGADDDGVAVAFGRVGAVGEEVEAEAAPGVADPLAAAGCARCRWRRGRGRRAGRRCRTGARRGLLRRIRTFRCGFGARLQDRTGTTRPRVRLRTSRSRPDARPGRSGDAHLRPSVDDGLQMKPHRKVRISRTQQLLRP